MTNLIVLVAFWGKAEHNVLKHIIVPVIGFLANLAMLGAIVYLNLTSGGSTATDTVIALAIVGVWVAAGVIWLVVNSASGKRSILHKEHPSKSVTEEPESAVSASEARAF